MRPYKIRSNDNTPLWEIVIQIITGFIPLAAIIAGVWQFNKGQRQNIELEYSKSRQNIELESHKARMADSIQFYNRLYEKKITVYTTISKSIAVILSQPNTNKIDPKLIREFEQMYYGEAILVEDSLSNSALNDFHRAIGDFNDKAIGIKQLKQIGMAACITLKDGIQNKEKRVNP